jgi:hypothetical protein
LAHPTELDIDQSLKVGARRADDANGEESNRRRRRA